MRYRFTMLCPNCDQVSETYADTHYHKRIRCGDCLINNTEVIELVVLDVRQVSEVG